MMTDAMDRLSTLYALTGEDWELDLNHSLTEPTCPCAIIQPEGWNISRYRYDCDTIEEAITRACEAVYREVVLRERVSPACPYTEGLDGQYSKWLDARFAGSDDKLPYPRLPESA